MTFAVAANEKGEKVLTMSKEYIERQRAIVDACNSLELYPSEYATLEDALNRIPAADVAPVRRGNWEEWWPGIAEIMTGEEKLYRCSACDAKYADIDGYKYCPYCGAKMNKEEA